MSMPRMVLWLGGMGMVLALACGGSLGCSDDEEDAKTATTTVVTNHVNGTVVTNVVVVPVAPVAVEPNAPAVAAVLDVAGEWNGVLNVMVPNPEQAHLDLDLDPNGGTISGQYFYSVQNVGVIGKANGTLAGNHMVLSLVPDQAVRYPTFRFDGHVNASATDYSGTFTADRMNGSGTFALQK